MEEFVPVAPRIVEYDTAWPALYATEAAAIAGALEGVEHAVEHIGSTAVPALQAKPVIDIMVGVPDYAQLVRIRAGLESIGYQWDPHAEVDEPRRKVFRKGPADMTQLRTHHLHLTLTGGEYWRRILAFRDQLRRSPHAAHRYAQVKQRLVTDCGSDSRAYTAGKHDVVKAIERQAGVDLP